MFRISRYLKKRPETFSLKFIPIPSLYEKSCFSYRTQGAKNVCSDTLNVTDNDKMRKILFFKNHRDIQR